MSAAEVILRFDPENEDALALLARSYLASQKEPQATIGYANRLLAALKQNAKPIELTDDDWVKKKSRLEGTGYWMLGKAAAYGADRPLHVREPLERGVHCM